MGAMGCSVIDVVAVSVSCLSYIHNLVVVNHPRSDHLPVEIGFSLTEVRGGEGGGVPGENREGKNNTVAS
ncbi:hypothetical protein J6590_088553 [Homalodisca vitripennis]|nr:hypothetical protein J6590_088553 [Homalodisca vitripennis]